MDQKSLLRSVYEIAPTVDPATALSVGEAEWPAIDARAANAEDAETCRLLSLSASEVGDWMTADLWRGRARVRAEEIGWPEMITALEMTRAFKALSVRNDDYARGRTLDFIQGEPSSVKIFQQLEPVAFGPDSGISVRPKSASIALIRRFVLEKRGSFQLAMNQWDEAVDSFTKAIDAAEGSRGFLKARGGLALA